MKSFSSEFYMSGSKMFDKHSAVDSGGCKCSRLVEDTSIRYIFDTVVKDHCVHSEG